MLKNAASSSTNQQSHSSIVPLNILRGTNLISQLEAQKYPTSFTACASEYDNIIVPSCPTIPIFSISQQSLTNNSSMDN